MSESKATVPELVLEEAAPSVPLPALIASVAAALREHPRLNGAYRDGRFELYGRVNVGWVVDGRVAPTLHDADARTVDEIATAMDDLEARVRDGSVTAAELSGATFTVLAAPVARVTPVILPPQAGILGVGRTGWLTLVADARIVDAARGAAFLGQVAAGVR